MRVKLSQRELERLRVVKTRQAVVVVAAITKSAEKGELEANQARLVEYVEGLLTSNYSEGYHAGIADTFRRAKELQEETRKNLEESLDQ